MAKDEPTGWVIEEPQRLPWYVYLTIRIPLIVVGIGLAIVPVIVFFGLIYGW